MLIQRQKVAFILLLFVAFLQYPGAISWSWKSKWSIRHRPYPSGPPQKTNARQSRGDGRWLSGSGTSGLCACQRSWPSLNFTVPSCKNETEMLTSEFSFNVKGITSFIHSRNIYRVPSDVSGTVLNSSVLQWAKQENPSPSWSFCLQCRRRWILDDDEL